jgi:hypothetical protein
MVKLSGAPAAPAKTGDLWCLIEGRQANGDFPSAASTHPTPGEWFTLQIESRGGRIATTVN